MVDTVEYGALMPIIIAHSQSSDDLTKQKALHWINRFLVCTNTYVLSTPRPKSINPAQLLLPFHSQMLQAILPNLSHASESIGQTSSIANKELIITIQKCNQVAYKEFILVISKLIFIIY
jgi:hypothetical protein